MSVVRRGIPGPGRRWSAVAIVAVATVVSFGLASTPVQAVTTPGPIVGGGQHAPFIGTSTSVRSGTSSSVSPNWAGFAATGAPVTSVAGDWTQPAATCPSTKLQQSAFWVGIDGFAATDHTVEQVGTDADCTKALKKVPSHPVYYAWYEMVPGPLMTLDLAHHPVLPGDALSASVSVAGSVYTLSISDPTESWSYSINQTVTTTPLPSNSSAEWIAEAPCSGSTCKVLPLADFGAVTFSGAAVNGGPVNAPGLTDHLITMSKKKTGASPKASTSPLDGTGHSFTINWLTN